MTDKEWLHIVKRDMWICILLYPVARLLWLFVKEKLADPKVTKIMNCRKAHLNRGVPAKPGE